MRPGQPSYLKTVLPMNMTILFALRDVCALYGILYSGRIFYPGFFPKHLSEKRHWGITQLLNICDRIL